MGKKSRLKKQRKTLQASADGKPYLRANPMSAVLHEVWRSTCEKGFAIYGRGVLYRVAVLRSVEGLWSEVWGRLIYR